MRPIQIIPGSTKENIKKLERKITPEIEDIHFDILIKQMRYAGNGLYIIPGTSLHSTCTRELMLLGIAAREHINFTIH